MMPLSEFIKALRDGQARDARYDRGNVERRHYAEMDVLRARLAALTQATADAEAREPGLFDDLPRERLKAESFRKTTSDREPEQTTHGPAGGLGFHFTVTTTPGKAAPQG